MEALVLSSVVVDEDDIDFDIDWFEDQGISMVPAVPLSQSQQASFDALQLSGIQSFATEYDSLGCCTLLVFSRSPYAASVILVPKKDKSNRMCVDYRRLNRLTVSELWPLPRIDDILDGPLGSQWFSNLDLKS